MGRKAIFAIAAAAISFAPCAVAQVQSLTPSNSTPPQYKAMVEAYQKKRAPILITDKPRAGNLGVTVADRLKKRDERQQYLQQQLEMRRTSPSTRLGGMAIYQPKDGGPAMLTNRLEKYEGRGDYRRIKIEFDPIVKPNRWGTTQGKYTDTDVHKYVTHFAKLYGVDESLVHAIIKVESGGNPYAVSSKGAAGLMQLMPGTAADLNVSNAFDPAENIGGGTQYISKLLALFNGDAALALAGYNAGPETVKQYGGIPPFQETQNYVDLVLGYWREFKANGNSFNYQKYDPALTPAALAKKREERIATKDVGDPARAQHEVAFVSGTTQVAEKISQQGEYFYLVTAGRTYRVKADQVQAVDGTPLQAATGDDMASIPDATVPLPSADSVQLAAQI